MEQVGRLQNGSRTFGLPTSQPKPPKSIFEQELFGAALQPFPTLGVISMGRFTSCMSPPPIFGGTFRPALQYLHDASASVLRAHRRPVFRGLLAMMRSAPGVLAPWRSCLQTATSAHKEKGCLESFECFEPES